MMIKSALMTTGYDVLDGPNTNPLVIFRQGAGHVRPNRPPIRAWSIDSGYNDWLGFLCGTQLPASFCTRCIPDRPQQLNSPSIAIGDLAGTQTVTRKVTNVGKTADTYAASVYRHGRDHCVVSPASLTLNPGETKSFNVTFTTHRGTLNAYAGGQLTWTGGRPRCAQPHRRSPGGAGCAGSGLRYVQRSLRLHRLVLGDSPRPGRRRRRPPGRLPTIRPTAPAR